MAAREDDTASKRKSSEEDSSPAAADQKADEMVAGVAAAKVKDFYDDGDDPFILNLNLVSRWNLMPPEWIENERKLHYEQIALYKSAYEDLENDSDDEAGTAEYEEWSKRRIWASVDLSGLNTVGGDSCGVDSVAVNPVGVNPPEEEEEEEEEKHHDADVAAAESSS